VIARVDVPLPLLLLPQATSAAASSVIHKSVDSLKKALRGDFMFISPRHSLERDAGNGLRWAQSVGGRPALRNRETMGRLVMMIKRPVSKIRVPENGARGRMPRIGGVRPRQREQLEQRIPRCGAAQSFLARSLTTVCLRSV